MVKKIFLLLLTTILLGCSSEVKLQLEFNKNCFNKYFNNEANVTVQKIGGGYESEEFTVDILEGFTLNLPEKGDYTINVKANDYYLNTELLGVYWDETLKIGNSGAKYNMTCP